MTTTTAPEYRTSGARPAPRFWQAPFARQTYRELGYVLSSLATAIIGFAWVVTMFSFGVGTLTTVLGFPVLALLLSGARGLGRLELYRVDSLLGLRLAPPRPLVVPADAGVWGRLMARLRDGAGWRAVCYQLVMFPWRIFSFCVSVVLWIAGLGFATLPAWNWVFPTYVGWPGYRVFDYYDSHHVQHAYYIASFWQEARACAAGIVLLFLAAWITHLLTTVSRTAARALLAQW